LTSCIRISRQLGLREEDVSVTGAPRLSRGKNRPCTMDKFKTNKRGKTENHYVILIRKFISFPFLLNSCCCQARRGTQSAGSAELGFEKFKIKLIQKPCYIVMHINNIYIIVNH